MTKQRHNIRLVYDKNQLVGGDILFLVSCTQIIGLTERDKFEVTLVLHASDLPRGRGWSPHVWSILNEENTITVSLIEAEEPVDSGPIWLKTSFLLEGHELLPEINEKLFESELHLMTNAIEKFAEIEPKKQIGNPGQYMRRRTPMDSELDPYKTIAQQFDLLRVADSKRYPAFFHFRGKKYSLRIEKNED